MCNCAFDTVNGQMNFILNSSFWCYGFESYQHRGEICGLLLKVEFMYVVFLFNDRRKHHIGGVFSQLTSRKGKQQCRPLLQDLLLKLVELLTATY